MIVADTSVKKPEDEIFRKLKWMMLFRLLFALMFLGGTLIYCANEDISYLSKNLIPVYWLTGWIILVSLCYAAVYTLFSNDAFFAYLQTGIDTFIVTAIIFLTGSYSSLFSFLYLIVIICATMLLSRKGSMIIAGLCCLQYGIMVDLEYYQVIRPTFIQEGFLYNNYEWNQVIYKMGTVMLACFLTLILSSYLAEQERRAQSNLQSMESQVKRMEKMAVVGEMASGLAHEIKNPLASLSGSIQMLMESSHEDPDQRKLMTIAVREAERLNSLVSDFLQFARPKKGNPEVVNIGRMIEETVSLLENNEKYKNNIVFDRQFENDLWIDMDPDQLKQVILNLMLNAAEAMVQTEGTVTVLAYRHKDQMIRLKIKDEGEGIDESVTPLIFDPFFTTKAKGTGLGLSIVLRILQSYDYQIDVSSEKGHGTTFTLKLKPVDTEQEKPV